MKAMMQHFTLCWHLLRTHSSFNGFWPRSAEVPAVVIVVVAGQRLAEVQAEPRLGSASQGLAGCSRRGAVWGGGRRLVRRWLGVGHFPALHERRSGGAV